MTNPTTKTRTGTETMSSAIIRALVIIKRSAVLANKKAKNLDARTCKARVAAASEVAEDKLDDIFPLSV